jgi:hypothetical protein
VAAAPFFSSIQDLLPQFPSSHKVESVLSLAVDGVPATGGDAEAPYTAAARPVAIKRADDAVSRQRAVLPAKGVLFVQCIYRSDYSLCASMNRPPSITFLTLFDFESSCDATIQRT